MSKKRRFGVSNAISRGLQETVSIVENNAGIFRNATIPLSRIELDPHNPRKMLITKEELLIGIPNDDAQLEAKNLELESLKGLANTIKNSGLIQPIAVYKHNENYRVVAGNRRTLAALIAGKSEIEARVFNERPNKYELKLIQLVENTAREDLTLYEKLQNINDVIVAYQQENNQEVTSKILQEITGYSLTLCKYYLSAIHAPQDVMDAIKEGKIQNLEKAALIANIHSDAERKKAIDACIIGIDLKELRQLASNAKRPALIKAKPGRAVGHVNLGKTTHVSVVKLLVEKILSLPEYAQFQNQFATINWKDYKQTTQAFKRFLTILEKNKITV